MKGKKKIINEDTIKIIGTEKEKTEFSIVFNDLEFKDNILSGYYYKKRNNEKKEIEVLPSIYYYETKKWDDDFLKKYHNKFKLAQGLFKKIIYLVIFAVRKCIFNNQKISKTIQIKNKRDHVKIFVDLYSNRKLIYENKKSRDSDGMLPEEVEENNDSAEIVRHVDPAKIAYPESLGKGSGRCIIWDIFETLGLMTTFDTHYKIFDIDTMLEASSFSESLLDECEKYNRCNELLYKFRNNTYENDSKKNILYDDIQLNEYNGYFIPSEGKHRVCIAKRFKIPVIYAMIYKHCNITNEEKKENDEFELISSGNDEDLIEVNKQCYRSFKGVGLNAEHVAHVLENNLTDIELINYIENINNKTFKELFIEIKKLKKTIFGI